MIIGISGKKQHGKNTVARIIEYITDEYFHHGQLVGTYPDFKRHYDININGGIYTPHWEEKQFAYKLKQMVALLIGCTVEQLEDNDFKEKPLGEEWNKVIWNEPIRLLESHEYYRNDVPYSRLTPRKLLQLVGTECGRDIIHPNIWVNALMTDYVRDTGYKYPVKVLENNQFEVLEKPTPYDNGLPNWIITDVRFPNEVKAIEDAGGIVIRVNRPFRQWQRTCMVCHHGFDKGEMVYNILWGKDIEVCPQCLSPNHAAVLYEEDKHPSEIALDNYPFIYTLNNDGSIDDLIEGVKTFLTLIKEI